MEINNYNKQIYNNSNVNPINNIIRNNRQNRPNIPRQRNEDNNFLKISGEVYHFFTKGELVLDLKTEDLVWTIKGEKTSPYKKKYGDKEKINIQKSNIKKVIKHLTDDKRYLLRIELKNAKEKEKPYNFSFQNNEKLRNKFYELLSNDEPFKFYKNEFQLLPIEQQKYICLLLTNKPLLELYRKLILINNDINNINTELNFIKYIHPEAITINLGKNRIQLSRDEELIMLSQRKYNTTKLLSSDSNIYESYINQGNGPGENFWKEFIEKQKANHTYIVGGYKPSICNIDKKDKNEKKEENSNLFEDLEKDKYYYDCYETNYLYHSDNMKNEPGKTKDRIALLNDYSINKIKDINYFSYTSLCMNHYNKERNIKNIFRKKNTNLNCKKMEEEIEINISNSNQKNRLKKEELLNKLKHMEIEHDNEKEDNSSYTTMKAINDENRYFYNYAKFKPSEIPIDNIITYLLQKFILIIKDLALEQQYCYRGYFEKPKKQEEKLSLQKKISNEQIIRQRLDRYNKEIRNLYENLKKKIIIKKGNSTSPKVLEFLEENVKRTIDHLIVK